MSRLKLGQTFFSPCSIKDGPYDGLIFNRILFRQWQLFRRENVDLTSSSYVHGMKLITLCLKYYKDRKMSQHYFREPQFDADISSMGSLGYFCHSISVQNQRQLKI